MICRVEARIGSWKGRCEKCGFTVDDFVAPLRACGAPDWACNAAVTIFRNSGRKDIQYAAYLASTIYSSYVNSR